MKGIRQKIILNAVIVIAIISVITTSILSVSAMSSTNATLIETLMPFAKTASKSIESNLHIMADRIFMISENKELSSNEATIEEKNDVLVNAASGIEFVWIGLYNEDGTLYTANGKSPSNISNLGLYNMLKETKNLVIGDTFLGENDLEIAVGIPIKSETSTQYLVGSYKYDMLDDIISSIHIGYSGHALVLNNDGKVMAHRDKNLVRNGETINSLYGDNKKMLETFNIIKGGALGSESVRIDGKDNLIVYVPIRGVNWYLSIVAPKADFTGMVNSAIAINSGITIVLILLAVLYIRRFSGKISESLGIVTKRIEKLAQGDLTSPVEVATTNDEAETLSNSLKNTIEDVSGYISELQNILQQLSKGNLNVIAYVNIKVSF